MITETFHDIMISLDDGTDVHLTLKSTATISHVDIILSNHTGVSMLLLVDEVLLPRYTTVDDIHLQNLRAVRRSEYT